MPVIQHVHKTECPRYDHKDWVCHVAPDVLWFSVQDVGSYQGSVYGFGLYKGKLLIYEDSYGSCSGCGAWGEGGEPETQEDLLKNSKEFDSLEDALAYLAKMDRYERPDMAEATEALKEASQFGKAKPKKSRSK